MLGEMESSIIYFFTVIFTMRAEDAGTGIVVRASSHFCVGSRLKSS